MDHELLTDEMVAELRQEIKTVAEESEAEGSGEERLNRWEQGARRVLNRLGAQLTEREVEWLGREQERGPRVCEQCGGGQRNVSRQAVTIQSIFGPLTVKRRRFTCLACEQTDYPLDRYYGWEQHRFTSTAKEWVCLLSQGDAYEHAADLLRRVSGIGGTVESFRQVVQECGGKIEAQQEELVRLVNETDQPYPAVSPPSKWMLVGADGCQVLKSGVKVGRPKKGEKRSRQRPTQGKGQKKKTRDRGVEVKVGVVGALICPPGEREYLVEQKSYVATFADAEAFSDLLFAESLQRGVHQAERVIVMGDGASWIWKRVAPLFPHREEIVDWYHLTEKVWETGEALYGSREHWVTRNWVELQLDKLWNGKLSGVQRALHLQRQKWEPRGNQPALDAIHTLDHYLTEHAPRMNYPRYRQMGLPISSSEVESACKQVVAARMKRSGMQWRPHTAAPLLPLRAEFLSGRWDQKWRRLRAAA